MKVKNAIIMAAGCGNRLLPLTAETPKPLLKIGGKSMIEHLIDTLESKHIDNIIIIVGYLKEQFIYLETKYNNVKLVVNENYDRMNNIASLYVARRYLDAATIIMDGDQIINNPNIIKTDISYSGYVCYEKISDEKEWTLQLGKSNKIICCDTDYQAFDYVLRSISYWTDEDAVKLRKFVEADFRYETRNDYWDCIPMKWHLKDFDFYAYMIKQSDLLEIDTIDEYRHLNVKKEK